VLDDFEDASVTKIEDAIRERLDRRPGMHEIAEHIQEIEQVQGIQVSCELAVLKTSDDWTDDEQARITRDFKPVTGRQILFEDIQGLKLLRAKDDGSGLVCMGNNKNDWKDFNIDACMTAGRRIAENKSRPYRAAYILNKIAPSGGNHAGPQDLGRTHMDSTASYTRHYGDRDVRGAYAGRFFLTKNIVKSIGLEGYSDDSEAFIKACGGAAAGSRSQFILDLFAGLGETPTYTLDFENSKGTKFKLDAYTIVVPTRDDSGFSEDKEFCLYAAMREDVVLSARLICAESNMEEFMPGMYNALSRVTSNLEAIARAGGVPPTETRNAKDVLASSREFRVVTLHVGTPYELQLPFERVSSLYVGINNPRSNAMNNFMKRVNESGKKWAYREMVDIALSSPRARMVARTIDFDILQYDFHLGDDANRLECVMFVPVMQHPDVGQLTWRVFPYLKSDAPSIDTVIERVNVPANQLGRERPLLSALRMKEELLKSPAPSVTGECQMVCIGDFWMTMRDYVLLARSSYLDARMTGNGLDVRYKEDFFRKALESCETPADYRTEDQATLDLYKVTVRDKSFKVLIGHHATHARNVVLYAQIIEAKWGLTRQKRRDILNEIRQHPAFERISRGLSDPKNDEPIPDVIPIPERQSENLFNLELDGKNYVFEAMGDFAVSIYPLPTIQKATTEIEDVTSGDEDRQKSIKAVNECQQQVGYKKFLEIVVTKAERCSGENQWAEIHATDAFEIKFYDTQYSNRAFKLAVATPVGGYCNLAIKLNIELAEHASQQRMISSIRRHIPDVTSSILVAINAMKKRGMDLPEKAPVPDHFLQKKKRMATRPLLPLPSSRDVPIIEIGDEDMPRENTPAPNRTATYKTFRNATEYNDEMIASVPDQDREGIKAMVRNTIDKNPNLRDLHNGLTPGSEHLQLIALGKLWLACVRRAPLPEPSFIPREENERQNKGEDGIKLRPLVKDHGSTLRERACLALVAALEVEELATKVLHPRGITATHLGNVYEPMVRMGNCFSTYTGIIKWATGTADCGKQAARQMLDWMDGKTTLQNVPRSLRMLAVITHYAEVGRGYSSSIAGLKERMQQIRDCTTKKGREELWKTLSDAYPPVLKWTEDAEEDYVDDGDDDDDMSIYSGNSEDLSELVDEPPDFLEKLKSSAQQEDELVPPTWTIPGTLVDALKKEHGDEPVDIVMKHLENRRYDTEPARDEYGRIRKGWVKCRLPLEHGNVPAALLFKHHEGNVTRVEFIHDDAMDID
jgi:hypothetical protein